MNAKTRTLIAAALVLGIASGPALAHAAPAARTGPASAAPATSAAPAPTAPSVATPPNAKALEKAIAGLGAQHPDATAALVRVGGTSGSWRGVRVSRTSARGARRSRRAASGRVR